MRINVCTAEDDYRAWLYSEHAVLASIAGVLDGRDHVLIRRGAFLDYDRFGLDWLSADTKRRDAIGVDRRNICLYQLAGVPETTVQAVLDATRDCDDILGSTVVSTSERRLLLHFEHSLPLAFRLMGRRLRVLHMAVELSDDLAHFEQVAQRLRDTGAFESVELEDTGLEDTVFDDLNDLENFVRRIELAELAPSPWLAESVCVWLTTVEPGLKEILHAAVSGAATALTNEQAAQVALSVRRYLGTTRERDVSAAPQALQGTQGDGGRVEESSLGRFGGPS